jgi:hypothetical protein
MTTLPNEPDDRSGHTEAGPPGQSHLRQHADTFGNTPTRLYGPELGEALADGRLRYMSCLHHIGLGRAHKGRVVKLLVADRSVRVIDATGELIRELTLDPSRCYQPIHRGLMSPMS